MLCTFNGNTFDELPNLLRDGAVGTLVSPKTKESRIVFKHERRWYAVTEPPYMEDITDSIVRDREATLSLSSSIIHSRLAEGSSSNEAHNTPPVGTQPFMRLVASRPFLRPKTCISII